MFSLWDLEARLRGSNLVRDSGFPDLGVSSISQLLQANDRL